MNLKKALKLSTLLVASAVLVSSLAKDSKKRQKKKIIKTNNKIKY